MKILYLSPIDSNRGWGAESFLNQGFLELGHQTICLDYRAGRRELYRRMRQAGEEGFDVLFLQRGENFPVELVELVQRPRLFWDSELPARWGDHLHLFCSDAFEHYFLWTQDILDELAQRNWIDADRCSLLMGACHPPLHRPLPEVKKDLEAVFIGSLTQRRAALLENLSTRFDITVVNAYGEDMVRYFNRAKVVLNLHASDFPTVETRVCEALGCGAFLLTEKLAAGHPFTNGELVEFKGLDDLGDKLDHYLRHDHEREAIAEKGLEAVLAGHTYRHRAQEIAAVMQSLIAAESEETA